MDITDEEFNDEFSMFGYNIENEDIFDRLKQICQLHSIDAAAVSIEWVAFAQTVKTKSLTLELLDHMERDRLSKGAGKQMKTPVRQPKKTYRSEEVPSGGGVDDILGAYATTPTSKQANKRQHTPDNPVNKRLMGVSGPIPAVPFSPTSFSPVGSTPSKSYGERKNAGDTVASFGSNQNSWKSRRNGQNEVHLNLTEETIRTKFKYMFQKLSDKAMVLNDTLEDMTAYLQKQHKKDDISHVALPVQECVTVAGRIACDSNGKLNSKSVLLEGSLETSGGKTIPVELGGVSQYSIFPGQVVLMDGTNNTGTKFVASKYYESVASPLPETKPSLQKGKLSIVVAAGPFTTTDSLHYEPLQDLLKYMQKETPDLCILLGPFIDSKQSEIEKAFEKQTFDEVFNGCIKNVVNQLQGTGCNTHIVLVPSQRDAHHEQVYPQPPYVIDGYNPKRVHMVSDPCTLVVDDVVIGITSTDILFHLGFEETSFPPASSDRLSRLSSHVLKQQSYYPLHPPSEDVNIDYPKFEEHAKMSVTPHIMIMPSDLKQFIKEVCGSCVVNPGRLAKAQTGGTYGRIIVSNTDSKSKPGGSIVDMISAQVRRI